jgi:hypothetical protein
MKISMPLKAYFSANVPDTTLLSTKVVLGYQIRAKRTGRGRLVTVQAGTKSWIVLLAWLAEVASAVRLVNNVFNFFLRGLSETLDENHSVLVFI